MKAISVTTVVELDLLRTWASLKEVKGDRYWRDFLRLRLSLRLSDCRREMRDVRWCPRFRIKPFFKRGWKRTFGHNIIIHALRSWNSCKAEWEYCVFCCCVVCVSFAAGVLSDRPAFILGSFLPMRLWSTVFPRGSTPRNLLILDVPSSHDTTTT